MRLFVGLALSEEAKAALERLTLRLRAAEDGLRWSSPEQWHITLVFLGTVEREPLKGLQRGLRRLALPEVELRIDGAGTFERAGVLYAAVEVTAGLARLQQAVAKVVRASEIAMEERPYHPHITLARSRNRSGGRTLERLKRTLVQQRVRAVWTAGEFLLYESEISASGSRYRVVERYGLGERCSEG
ncbi:MAG TPA: RNA 2',3'-cyclic phosphodiesterase [Acidobacteriaceae bacterium]|jgi:2'-5' RNA ligase|nr:RNA 2',3'-cyclic phosphodiesterase [Acidobacteriaceae bacterium]